jgi:uncharacterized protein YndB with AHSA1/START domain
MSEPSVIHNTFVLERSYPVPPERVFAAFADPAKKRRWFVEGDQHEVEHFEMDFRVGGREIARFRMKEGTPIAGMTLASAFVYLDIVPSRRIVAASTMSLDGRCFSASLVTIELLPSETETTLVCTHQGAFFEGADGPAMREAGWVKLLGTLAAELRK